MSPASDYDMEKKYDFKSSVGEKGEVIDKYVMFSSGNEKTFRGVLTDSIQQSQFTRFDLVNGTRVYVNTRGVDFFEVHNARLEEDSASE